MIFRPDALKMLSKETSLDPNVVASPGSSFRRCGDANLVNITQHFRN